MSYHPRRQAINVFCVVAVAILFLPPLTPAAEPIKRAVTARLVADAEEIGPGQTFTLGVLLDLAPGWHVYWTNPGDAGLPTRLTFQLPPGFRADDVQFPAPARFAVGDIVSYGYADAVLLTARVRAPADLKPAAKVKVAASVQWMACKDVCTPGAAEVEFELPAADRPRPANEALFKEWADRVPVDVAASPDVAKVEWNANPAAREAVAVVTWRAGAGGVTDVELFPAADDALDVGTVSVSTAGGRTRLVARVRVLAGQTPKGERLPAVIAYTDKAGVRRGVNTALPLAAVLK